MNPLSRRLPAWIGIATLTATASLTGSAQSLVRNPSFENNLNNTTPPLAQGAPQGWPYYSTIDDWQGNGGTGINDLVYDPGGPFHNNGTPVPDGRRIGFKQGGGSISQDITGLVPGLRYWIQFRYDARNGSDLDLGVRFSTLNQGGALDEELDLIRSPRPARATSSPYYSRTVPFVPDAEGGTLRFTVTARGDSTALFDAVTIVQRDEGNFPVLNPSFEASGLVFDGESSAGRSWPTISGWAKTGTVGVDDGSGGVADNGVIPDQAIAVFIDGEGSLSQTLDPVVRGDEYQLEFAYNARLGNTPHLLVLVDGVVLWEKDVTAVGNSEAYTIQKLSFKPTSDSTSLTFSNATPGATVLLDNVKVLGRVGTKLPPLSISPSSTLVRLGETTSGSITIPAERVPNGTSATLKIRSTRPEIIRLTGADNSGILSLTFDSTHLTQPFTLQGINVGSAGIEFVDSAGLLLPADITAVWVPGHSFITNPSFEIDKDSSVGTAPITAWTTSGGNIGIATSDNPFLSGDDFGIPDRRKLLRMQGGGTASQTVSGLVPGQQYGLQFFYNGRSVGYPYTMSLQVTLGDDVLLEIPEVIPARQNGLNSFYFHESRFTAKNPSALLTFKATVSSGDASLFLDAISIVPRITGEIAVMNSSFEASASGASWPGYLDRPIAGWTTAGGGYGVNAYSPNTFFVEPFFDGGINSDQDNVFFGQGGVSLRQSLTGLSPGDNYTLVFDYNFRDGRGTGSTVAPNPGQYEVTLGSTFVTLDEPGLPSVDTISPWTGYRHTRPFYQAFIPFNAESDTMDLTLRHVGVNGDETILIDNVRVIAGNWTAPTLDSELENQTVSAGQSVTFTINAPGQKWRHRWFRDGVELKDGALISGATGPTLTILQTSLTDAGTYSVLVSDGVAVVGSTAQLTVESSNSVLLNARRSGNNTVIIAWPRSLVGYQLQRASNVNGPWLDVTTTPTENGANAEVNVTVGATEGPAFFRLFQ